MSIISMIILYHYKNESISDPPTTVVSEALTGNIQAVEFSKVIFY